MFLFGKQNKALTSHYLKADRIISSEFSYLFPHTSHQSACHPLQHKEKKNHLNQKNTGKEKKLAGLTRLNSDIRK